jgi:hypothetical protein
LRINITLPRIIATTLALLSAVFLQERKKGKRKVSTTGRQEEGEKERRK